MVSSGPGLHRGEVFSKRHIEPELLDHLSPEEARPNLADLVRINSRFGGHSVILRTLAAAVRADQSFSLLDIGAASGDTARLIRARYPAARVTSLDYNRTNLEKAPYPKLLADAFELPFGAGAFDFVLCSLFLHHFSDDRVVSLLASFYKVSRCALLVTDLERHLVPYAFLPATRFLFGWHNITVHDGIISVRASFRKPEMRDLFQQAGINNVEIAVHRPAFRISAVARK
jgi:2-polyprenyl-3-methyl-5-hydroxy-6-metoxy-1,4-benzoquinol methylase